jgi:hypothetical protein
MDGRNGQMDDDRTTAPTRVARRPWRARLAAALLVSLGIILPGTVLASHAFSDVPTSSTFHAAVAALAEAGITTGCASGKYCPADAVRRDQMAAFLTRGLGRVAGSTIEPQTVMPGQTEVTLSELTIETQGRANLHVLATFPITMGGGSYPCTANFYISVDGANSSESPYTVMRHRQNVAPPVSSRDQMAGQAIRIVEGGSHAVELILIAITDGTCNVTINAGLLTATVVPFGPDGLTP